jgi:hypothetical protein
MCLSLHPHNIGRSNAAKHLDEAPHYILGHDGVWNTTADDIAEYYIANYYDQVSSWVAKTSNRHKPNGSEAGRQGCTDHRLEPRHRSGDRQSVCCRGLQVDALGAFGRAVGRSASGITHERSQR